MTFLQQTLPFSEHCDEYEHVHKKSWCRQKAKYQEFRSFPVHAKTFRLRGTRRVYPQNDTRQWLGSVKTSHFFDVTSNPAQWNEGTTVIRKFIMQEKYCSKIAGDSAWLSWAARIVMPWNYDFPPIVNTPRYETSSAKTRFFLERENSCTGGERALLSSFVARRRMFILSSNYYQCQNWVKAIANVFTSKQQRTGAVRLDGLPGCSPPWKM